MFSSVSGQHFLALTLKLEDPRVAPGEAGGVECV